MLRRNRKFLRATGEEADIATSQAWLFTGTNEDSDIPEESGQNTTPSEAQGEGQEGCGQTPEAGVTVDARNTEQGILETTTGTMTVTRQGRVSRLPERLKDYVKL